MLFFVFLPVKEQDKHADDGHPDPYHPEQETTLE
jgi:hypothetical protein